jgi:long-chain fatty acid transport protein
MKYIILIFLIIITFPYSLFATGFETNGIGSRALSMGGAFIGLADDNSAIWWNPAGLTQVKRREFFITIITGFDTSTSSESMKNIPNPLKNGDFQKIYDNEPERFKNKDYDFMLLEPFIGVLLGNIKGFSTAISFYGSSGAGVNWGDSILSNNGMDLIDAKYYLKNFSSNLTLSIAREIFKNLSLGLNINYIYGKNEFQKRKTYIPGNNSNLKGYLLDFKQDSDGSTFSFDGGVLFKPHKRFSIGAIIRGDYYHRMKGNALLNLTILNVKEATKFKQKVHFPLRYGIGIAFKPSNKITLTADLYRVEWSKMKQYIDYDKDEGLLNDKYIDMNLRTISELRLGMEYLLSDKYSLRFGYWDDQSFNKRENASLSTPRLLPSDIITFGLGINKIKWQMDFIFLFAFHKQWGIEGIKYDDDWLQFGISYAYRF